MNYIGPYCGQLRPAGERIRVGLLSKFFFNHSIGQTSRGLFAHFSREEFEVTAIFVAPAVDDDYSRFIRQHAEGSIVVPQNLAEARRLIAALRLDVLTRISDEPFTHFLAYSRLAPVQCVAWAIPI
jgi:predicted O-linked N-acetylglucosamine transferase (SPINDLY family)